jgi:hypothetical protein
VALNAFAMLLVPVLVPAGPSAADILAAVARTSATRHTVAYSGWRQYSIHNLRFGKSASAKVRITSDPGQGKQFTIANQTGHSRLIGVIETLLSSEADASRPENAGRHEIGPANYTAALRGSETVAGRDCWVLAITPKSKNKYLLKGTAWVDKKTYALVRLDGVTASSVSMWVGAPHIVQDFAPVDGVWLPVHMVSNSSTFLLGDSGLDVRYTNYQVKSSDSARR